jgi:excisionase family DNA binding protein
MTVYRLTYAGELPSVKFGGAKRIRQSDLRAFIAAHASAPEAES